MNVVALLHLALQSPENVLVSTNAELAQAVRAAKPGATIELAPGNYLGNIHFSNIHGEQRKPILIRASDPKNRPRFSGGIQFSKVSHIVIRDLVIERSISNGLNIDDGGTVTTPSHHVLIENVSMVDTPRGNNDGIKLSGVDDFIVSNCNIERWGGSGIDMVGCHRGKIKSCTFRQGGSNSVQAKGGSSDIAIEKCRFENYGQRGVNLGGSTGTQYFRPPVSSMPPAAKYEARSIRVSGSTFFQGGAPIAFVGVDGATVEFNTFYKPERWVMRILQETTEPGFVPSRNGVFKDNLVVFRSDQWSAGGVNIGPNTAPDTFSFAHNFWYCEDRPGSGRPQLPTREIGGTYGVDPRFLNPVGGDLRVSAGSPASSVGAHAWRGQP